MNQHSLFTGTPEQVALAAELYELVADMPIISPHGHVDLSLIHI
jgi:glucuronate isomerase